MTMHWMLQGVQPLHMACLWGMLDAASALLAAGADANTYDDMVSPSSTNITVPHNSLHGGLCPQEFSKGASPQTRLCMQSCMPLHYAAVSELWVKQQHVKGLSSASLVASPDQSYKLLMLMLEAEVNLHFASEEVSRTSVGSCVWSCMH